MDSIVHFKRDKLNRILQPKELGLDFIEVERIELTERRTIETGGKENVLVVIDGSVEVQTAANEAGETEAVGPGETGGTFLLGFRDMIYLPIGSKCELGVRPAEDRQADKTAVVMRYAAPAARAYPVKVFTFAEVDADPQRHAVAGSPGRNSRRDVWKFIDANFDCDRLMMGQCLGSVGGWTAWPPHEHAEKKEEVYTYFAMGGGFGVQLVYDELDSPYGVFLVEDGDVVSIGRGYHPNVGSPAAPISYIYCMAAKRAGERDFAAMHFQERFKNE